MPEIGTVLNVSAEYTIQLDRARAIMLPDVKKDAIVMDLTKALNKKVAARVMDMANSDYNGGKTLFDMINAITSTAKSYQPAMQSEIERYAGRLLEMAA